MLASAVDKPIMVLDLGSSRTAALLLVKRGDEFAIEGSGIAIGGGIKGGMIVDMPAAVSAVAKAGEQAERTAGATAGAVLVALPAAMSRSRIITKSVAIAERVRRADLDELLDHGDSAEKIIHQNVIDYSLDGVTAIKNPLAMRGRTLVVRLHRVVAEPSSYANLLQILRSCRFVSQIHLVPAVCAAAEAVLSNEERRRSALLVDMGASITSFALFSSPYDGDGLIHTDFVPLGGDYVTRDIAYAFTAAKADAERLKLNPDLSQINGMDGGERVVHPREIRRVITARLEETFELVLKKVSAPPAAMDYRLVLTGGASRIKDAAAVAGRIFGRPARLAKPSYRTGLPQSVHGPSFAALLGAADNAQVVPALIRPQSSWLNRLGLWFKECFEDEAELCK